MDTEIAEALPTHVQALRRYALALTRERQAADDLVQETLLRALDRAHTFRAGGDLRAWLMSILHNVFMSDRRRESRRACAPLDDDLAGPTPDHHAIELVQTMRALSALPEDQRQAIMIAAVDGATLNDAAKALGIRPGTLMSRLARGRAALRRALDGEEEEDGARPRLRVLKGGAP